MEGGGEEKKTRTLCEAYETAVRMVSRSGAGERRREEVRGRMRMRC
jgi:hypothetical protein